MKSLTAAYKNELFKIRRKKKLIVAAALIALLVLGAAVAVICMNRYAGVRVRGGTEFATMVLSIANKTLIPLFTAFVCIDMFSGEYTNRTIRLSLTRPITRCKLFTAKVLAAGSFLLAQLLFLMLLSLLAEIVIRSGGVDVWRVLVAYLAAALPLMVFALLVIVISNLARGSASSFFITIFVFLAFVAAQILLSGYQSFFFTSALDWHVLFIGSYINVSKILRVLCILLGCGTMLFAGGYYLFERKEF